MPNWLIFLPLIHESSNQDLDIIVALLITLGGFGAERSKTTMQAAVANRVDSQCLLSNQLPRQRLNKRSSRYLASMFLSGSANALLKANPLRRSSLLCQSHRLKDIVFRTNSEMTTESVEFSGREETETVNAFDGLSDSSTPLGICQTNTLPPALTLANALDKLQSAIIDLKSTPPAAKSGILRFQVPLPQDVKALDWLQSQPQSSILLPRCYFSPRGYQGSIGELIPMGVCKRRLGELDKNVVKGVAGIGSAVLFKSFHPFTFKDWRAIKRFLSEDCPLIRAYGAIRFNSEMEPSIEWSGFGSFYFVIPQIELNEFEGGSLLAVTIAWDRSLLWTFNKAINALELTLHHVCPQVTKCESMLHLMVIKKDNVPDENSWDVVVQKVLEIIDSSSEEDFSNSQHLDRSSFLDKRNLSKVVLARRTKFETNETIDPLALVACLQEKDQNAYQFCFQLHDSTTFIGSTPEQLFYRNGVLVSSEAVAGTRARGHTSTEDEQIGLDLLLSAKDHREFQIVQETIKEQMKIICKHVGVESQKSLIKQARVQHLYARLIGELESEAGEFDLLSLLHPTPAVCGHPRESANNFISQNELFDRGMYAGPVGWFGGKEAEFAVGIRSALMQKDNSITSQSSKFSQATRLFVYAGAGIVKGAESSSEWLELELKTSQFEALLQPSHPLHESPNINAVWASLIVEECCRLGIMYFCIAPGSRSSPITVAAAQHPRVSCISCIDERSLAFHALGYGRGSNKPAAIVTSSGTAVSNIFPAVVEASQDCVPLLVLTADRPPELHDTGANQTINQVNHFGSFVRYHISLPAADDNVPARILLTTLDTAIFRATQAPCGPVHINCAFREPLAGIPSKWSSNCLKGLNTWMSTSKPFTKYMRITPVQRNNKLMNNYGMYKEVGDIIQGATHGLVIVGGLQTAEETWAALLFSRHLGWPIVSDILSGLRLRKHASALGETEKKLYMIDMLDHVLLCKSIQDWLSPDVVVQIGSRLTSKRIGQLLVTCHPHAYIMVESHPYRHDPSHIVTHRIQASVVEFVAAFMEVHVLKESNRWCKWLQVLNDMVDWEISFQLKAEPSITEPYVSRRVSQSLCPDSALFLGNSMVIRDLDMYGLGWSEVPETFPLHGLHSAQLFTGLKVAGNRGASGIDGVLSTAIGYAVGSNQRVLLMVGDVSFLHDTNGLTLLKERLGRPPITIVVTNNHGGAIFSLLPVADTAPPRVFRNFFSTPHDVSISKLCLAHRVNHMLVQTKQEFESALLLSQSRQLDWVIEVDSHIEYNTTFHRFLQQSACQATNRAFRILCGDSQHPDFGYDTEFIVLKMEYSHYRISLSAPPTTTAMGNESQISYRKGFLLTLIMNNGKRGFGEVAPLEGLHEEDLLDVEEQLRFLVHRTLGVKLNYLICLLNDSFSTWIWQDLAIPPCSLFPSVRCGLEMAILSTIAAIRGCNIADLLCGTKRYMNAPLRNEESASRISEVSSRIPICGLLDSKGLPDEVACAAEKLVEQGFHAIKLKVARRLNPLEDTKVLYAVRQKVGPLIEIRADANRKWTFSQALQFAISVKDCNLQYIEEPVERPGDILAFCEESGLPVALDETIDENMDHSIERLSMFAHPGIVATVIKPSRVGGFEHSAMIAKWAQKHGKMAIISAAFESSISLAAYIQFAHYIDNMNLEAGIAGEEQDRIQAVAHGLGTYSWLLDDTVNKSLQLSRCLNDNNARVAIEDAAALLQNIDINPSTIKSNYVAANISSYIHIVYYKDICFSFNVMDTGTKKQDGNSQEKTFFFLHGFLGTCKDWIPVMQALSLSARCISVDLPGHGKTEVYRISERDDHNGNGHAFPAALEELDNTDSIFSMEIIGEVLSELIFGIAQERVVLVGYSMGGRIALYMSLRCSKQVAGAAIISGSPGLQDSVERSIRAARDDTLAKSLLSGGMQSFVEMWYKKDMWQSLKNHPYFKKLQQSRTQHGNIRSLAKVLSSLSIGRQPPLWDDLADCQIPLLLIVGQKDQKFKKIAQQMCKRKHRNKQTGKSSNPAFPSDPTDESDSQSSMVYSNHDADGIQPEASSASRAELNPQIAMLEVPNSGHAVHLENPLPLIRAIRKFLIERTF